MSSSPTITDDLSTPGEILLEEFLEPLGVSQYALAKTRAPSQRRLRDAEPTEKIITIYKKNYDVYGVRKMRAQQDVDIDERNLRT